MSRFKASVHGHCFALALAAIALGQVHGAEASAQVQVNGGEKMHENMIQEIKDVESLRKAREDYVPGKWSARYRDEFKSWCKGRDWTSEKKVLEFVDSEGYRHLLGLACVDLDRDADAEPLQLEMEKARLMASFELTQVVGTTRTSVSERVSGGRRSSSLSISSRGTLAGVMPWMSREWTHPETGKHYVVVIVGKNPGIKDGLGVPAKGTVPNGL